MQGLRRYRRLSAAFGAAAVLAMASSAPSLAGARIQQPPKTRAMWAHPVVKDAAGMQVVSHGYGCGDLEVFVIVENGQQSLPMC